MGVSDGLVDSMGCRGLSLSIGLSRVGLLTDGETNFLSCATILAACTSSSV